MAAGKLTVRKLELWKVLKSSWPLAAWSRVSESYSQSVKRP